jgi:hypothetical protein
MRKPLLRQNTVAAESLRDISPGTRVLIDWDGLDRDTCSDALAIHRISGWTIRHDNRMSANILILEGRNWRGEVRYLSIHARLIRVECHD